MLWGDSGCACGCVKSSRYWRLFEVLHAPLLLGLLPLLLRLVRALLGVTRLLLSVVSGDLCRAHLMRESDHQWSSKAIRASSRAMCSFWAGVRRVVTGAS
jgi:hypothetical protein